MCTNRSGSKRTWDFMEKGNLWFLLMNSLEWRGLHFLEINLKILRNSRYLRIDLTMNLVWILNAWVRSYRGGEFISNEFKNICGDIGIKTELSTPNTLQQNGIPKRRNRSVI